MTTLPVDVTGQVFKDPTSMRVAPSLVDHAEGRTALTWVAARMTLGSLRGGRGLNIAHERVDRHASGPLGVGMRYPAAIAESLALLQERDGCLAARHRAITTLHTSLGLEVACLLADFWEVP